MEQRKITIGHLYPDLLNLYGDRGNIACMMQRCIWRGIEAETKEFNQIKLIFLKWILCFLEADLTESR